MVHKALEHGGNLDHHIDLFGGEKSNWIDLSTGINNSPYPIPKIPKYVWMSLPDKTLTESFQTIARDFWKVPKNAHIIAANGTSSIISLLPSIFKKGSVDIYHPSYNEYEAAFLRNGWKISNTDPEARILVNPNNPDGKYWNSKDILSSGKLTIIDESFCDLTPNKSLIEFSDQPGVIILKSFGKFWGLAGLRLGCAIASSETLRNLENALGPWPASGPALYLASMALQNKTWVQSTIENLNNFDSLILDRYSIQFIKDDLKSLKNKNNLFLCQAGYQYEINYKLDFLIVSKDEINVKQANDLIDSKTVKYILLTSSSLPAGRWAAQSGLRAAHRDAGKAKNKHQRREEEAKPSKVVKNS